MHRSKCLSYTKKQFFWTQQNGKKFSKGVADQNGWGTSEWKCWRLKMWLCWVLWLFQWKKKPNKTNPFLLPVVCFCFKQSCQKFRSRRRQHFISVALHNKLEPTEIERILIPIKNSIYEELGCQFLESQSGNKLNVRKTSDSRKRSCNAANSFWAFHLKPTFTFGWLSVW